MKPFETAIENHVKAIKKPVEDPTINDPGPTARSRNDTMAAYGAAVKSDTHPLEDPERIMELEKK